MKMYGVGLCVCVCVFVQYTPDGGLSAAPPLPLSTPHDPRKAEWQGSG